MSCSSSTELGKFLSLFYSYGRTMQHVFTDLTLSMYTRGLELMTRANKWLHFCCNQLSIFFQRIHVWNAQVHSLLHRRAIGFDGEMTTCWCAAFLCLHLVHKKQSRVLSDCTNANWLSKISYNGILPEHLTALYFIYMDSRWLVVQASHCTTKVNKVCRVCIVKKMCMFSKKIYF